MQRTIKPRMGGIIIENRRETRNQTQNGWHYGLKIRAIKKKVQNQTKNIYNDENQINTFIRPHPGS